MNKLPPTDNRPHRAPDEPTGSWDDPDLSLLNRGGEPAPPLLLELFGSWKLWIREAAAAASAPADYVAFGLLVVVCSLIGNSRRVVPDPGRSDWTEPFALWCALVGSPSSGKTPALKPIVGCLQDLEAEAQKLFEPIRVELEADQLVAEEALVSWQADVKKAIKDGHKPPEKPKTTDVSPRIAPPRHIVSNATFEALIDLLQANPRGLLQCVDELAAWFNGMNRYSYSSDRPMWLSLFHASPVSMDRVGLTLTGGRHADRALVSVLGGIQPEPLAECLGKCDDGLMARFIYIAPDPIPLTRSDSPTDLATLRGGFRALWQPMSVIDERTNFQVVDLPFTPPAAQWFFEFRSEAKEIAENSESLLSSFAGKAPGVVARVAGCLELLEWIWEPSKPAPTEVSLQSVERACKLWSSYLLPMAVRAFGIAAEAPEQRDAVMFLREIARRKKSVINVRDIVRHWKISGTRRSDRVASALHLLEGAGWVESISSRDGEKSGRPRKDWKVNPKLFEKGLGHPRLKPGHTS